MARPLRLELAGGLYHVTSRGDRREDIFLGDEDRQAWVDLLADVCDRFNWVCHAWCAMGNHYHLLLETPDGNLSRGMRQLNGVYTQRFNRTHDRVGHVFQGRYKAILAQRESYLLELARYVVLNPVRAGMVDDPGEWEWSSYRAMVGEAPCPVWLHTDVLLSQFGPTRVIAQQYYRDFVRAGMGLPSIWDSLRGQIYLGDDDFIARATSSGMPADNERSLREVPRRQRRPLARPLAEFAAQAADRTQAMATAYATGDYTLAEVAAAFGVHYATVSRAVKAARQAKAAPPAAGDEGQSPIE